MNVYDIVIIGGGASGMMAAIGALNTLPDVSVAIVEKKHRKGRKILVTGKGRCNITNMSPWNEFCTHIHPKSNTLKHSFMAFNNNDIKSLLEENGLQCVIERGNRLFPGSSRAMDVVDTLSDLVARLGAETISEFRVSAIRRDNGTFHICNEDGTVLEARTVIVATGGKSYPSTGSEGDGYAFASSMGHSITPLFPSLTALTPLGYEKETRKLLEGIHLKNVSLTLLVDGDKAQSEFGEMDFTNGGIEGSIGFRVSRKAVKAITNGSKVELSIDLKPGIEEDELRSRIDKEPLASLLPGRVAKAFSQTAASDIRKRGMAAAMKDWRFRISSYVGYERAVITAGGVSMNEINPKTMESKLVSGLYFCGEILDLDGDTGGYNLQIAWSTGACAGRAAAKSIGNL